MGYMDIVQSQRRRVIIVAAEDGRLLRLTWSALR